MKIAMVSDHASPLAVLGGGPAGERNVHIAELSAALHRSGHQVTVYTRRDDPELPEVVDTAAGYRVVHVAAGPPKALPHSELLSCLGDFGHYLDQQWRSERPDVAHAHFWTSGIATQLAAKVHDIPTVQTFHTLGAVQRRHDPSTSDKRPQSRARLETLVAKGATWVTASSNDEVFELIRMGRSRSRISVVPCGVDSDTFTPVGPVAPRRLRRRIIAAGELLPRMGFDTVIAALPWIPDTELVIIGGQDPAELADEREVRRLRKLAAKSGVAERVRFHSTVPRHQLPELLRSADVVACTPWYESFGPVALEAMACGVPVIASAVGGMLDTVVDEVTGFLIPPKSAVKFAEAANVVLRDNFFGRSLGAAGRDRACSRYSWDRVAADTVRIYERVVPAFDDLNVDGENVGTEASAR